MGSELAWELNHLLEDITNISTKFRSFACVYTRRDRIKGTHQLAYSVFDNPVGKVLIYLIDVNTWEDTHFPFFVDQNVIQELKNAIV